jgi:poly(A) polymerase
MPAFDPTPALARAFSADGKALYLVGGSVRDRLLGRPTQDLDYTTDARPPQIKRLLKRAGAESIFAVGEKFGTIGANFGDTTVEVTTYRSEQYERGSRKPSVEFGDSLLGDLSRRDFTINALAQDTRTGELVDPFGGRLHLEARLIRAVGEAADRFADDPLRLLRAIRLAVQLGFTIESSTREAMAARAGSLAEISRERIAQEMAKILVSPQAGAGIRALCDLGLMRHIVPEVLAMRGMRQDSYHHKDVFEHTLQVVDRSPATVPLRWAALLHDIAKPRTRSVENGEVHFFGHERVGEQMARKILTGLRLDRQTIDRVATLVGMHQRANSYDDDWTDGAVRRFMREAGDALEDLLALSAADVTSRRPDRIRAAAKRVNDLQARIAEIRAREEVEKLASPLDGNELMALFDRGPGPWIRPIKERLLAAVLDGALAPDDKEGAAALARETLAAVESAQ